MNTFEDWLAQQDLGTHQVISIARVAWQAGYEAGRNAPLVKSYAGGVPNYCTVPDEDYRQTWYDVKDAEGKAHKIAFPDEAAPSQEPALWEFLVNGEHVVHSSSRPPDDAYDEGTLVPLYTTPPDATAQIAKLEADNAFLKDAVDAAIKDRDYYRGCDGRDCNQNCNQGRECDCK